MAIPESHIDLLERAIIWHVATIGPKGEPQSTPVWAGPDGDGTVVISMLRRRQKVKNLEVNPAIALSAYEQVDGGYRHLELRGTATIEEDLDHSLIHTMAKKYLGVEKYAPAKPNDVRVIIRIAVQYSHTMG